MMKDKKKKTNRYRIAPVFIGVLVFVVLVVVAISYELQINKLRIVSLYNEEQDKTVQSVALLVQDKQKEGAGNDDLVTYIPTTYHASGNCYLVLESNQEIIFAKTVSNTSKLYNNRRSETFWKNLNEQNIQVSSTEWNFQGNSYKLSLVTETDSIYDLAGVVQHNYYVLLTVIIVCVVLFSLLVTYVGMLDKANYDLNKTQNELATRNTDMEAYINNEIDSRHNGQGPRTDSEFEQSYSRLEKFMDVSVLRALLSKSNTEDLRPVKMIVIKFVMSDRYYSISEISEFASCISDSLNQRESMFELCKGAFGIVVYKASDAEVNRRKEMFLKKLNEKNGNAKVFVGFTSSVYAMGTGEDAVIEDFEVIYKEIVG